MGARYMSASHARMHFTRARLLEVFDYSPETGALVDRSTGDEVVRTNNYGYRWVWSDGAALLVHRIAFRVMTGEWPTAMVDHIDGVRTNNAWRNLREANHSLNAQNYKRAMRTNKLGVLGVCIDPRAGSKPFRAGIEINGKKHSLGTFQSCIEAEAAYREAKARLHPGYVETTEATQ